MENHYDRLDNPFYVRRLIETPAAYRVPVWVAQMDHWFLRDLEIAAYGGPVEGPYPICRDCGELVADPGCHAGFTQLPEEERNLRTWLDGAA